MRMNGDMLRAPFTSGCCHNPRKINIYVMTHHLLRVLIMLSYASSSSLDFPPSITIETTIIIIPELTAKYNMRR